MSKTTNRRVGQKADRASEKSIGKARLPDNDFFVERPPMKKGA